MTSNLQERLPVYAAMRLKHGTASAENKSSSSALRKEEIAALESGTLSSALVSTPQSALAGVCDNVVGGALTTIVDGGPVAFNNTVQPTLFNSLESIQTLRPRIP